MFDENKADGLIKWLGAIPDIPYDVRGVKFTAECPCGGTITAMRVEYNGHLRAGCDKCGTRMMM